MKWKEIANRLNGFSIASVGVQWTPKPTDSEVARRVIRFLEDRRVLYNDYAWEVPERPSDRPVAAHPDQAMRMSLRSLELMVSAEGIEPSTY
jgi:hypothetical protein